MKNGSNRITARYTIVIRSAKSAPLAALWKPQLEKACREARRESARGDSAPR